jgi:hypothetical protein
MSLLAYKNLFNAECIGMFMLYSYTKFLIYSSNGPLDISITRKAKQIRATAMMFLLYKKLP